MHLAKGGAAILFFLLLSLSGCGDEEGTQKASPASTALDEGSLEDQASSDTDSQDTSVDTQSTSPDHDQEPPPGQIDTSSVSILAGSAVYEEIIGDAPGIDEYRWWNQDFGWRHTFDTRLGKILKVTLEIRAWDVDRGVEDEEIDVIYADGVVLGILEGANEIWWVTEFDVDPVLLEDGLLDIWIDIDSTHTYDWWAVTIDWSKLIVEYEPKPRVIHVDPEGAEEAPYDTFGKGFKEIADALEEAIAGDTVVVESATYPEHDLKIRSGVTLVSKAALQIAGIDPEAVLEDQEVVDYRYTVEQIKRFDPGKLPPMPCPVPEEGIKVGQKTYRLPLLDASQKGRVIKCLSGEALTRIVGFRIHNGKAGKDPIPEARGGGIRCEKSNIQIIFNEFKSNKALRREFGFFGEETGEGGGIYLERTKGIISKNSFIKNESEEGGGIFIDFMDLDTYKIKVTHNTFFENIATSLGGGAIKVSTARAEISYNKFIKNRSTRDVEAKIPGYIEKLLGVTTEEFNAALSTGSGGAIFVTDVKDKRPVSITGNIFEGNLAMRDGGAIEVIEDAMAYWTGLSDKGPKVNITGNTIGGTDENKPNIARDDGGGISVTLRSTVEMNKDQLIGNEAAFNGGALHTSFLAELIVKGCGFYSNKAKQGSGGAIYKRDGGKIVINGCVIESNMAKRNGGGIFVGREFMGWPFDVGNQELTYAWITDNKRIKGNSVQSDLGSPTLGEGSAMALTGDIRERRSIDFKIANNKCVTGNFIWGRRGAVEIEGIKIPVGSAIFIQDTQPIGPGFRIVADNRIFENRVFGIKMRQTVKDELKLSFHRNLIRGNYGGVALINIRTHMMRKNKFSRNVPIGFFRIDHAVAGLLLIHGITILEDNKFIYNLPVQIRVDGKDGARVEYTDLIGSPIREEMLGKGYNVGILITVAAGATIYQCNICGHRKPRGPKFVTRAGVWRLGPKDVEEVDATYCWWGDESGPLSEDNPEGEGERVIGRVKTKPFLRQPVKKQKVGSVCRSASGFY
jgi:hypothetical protein